MITEHAEEKIDIGRITTYQAGVVQAAANRNLQRQCNEILRPFGLTKTHWLIVGTVLDAGPRGIRVSELAKVVGVNMPYLTNAVNLLENKDILSRRLDLLDNRAKYVSVNPIYRETAERIEQEMRKGLRQTIYSQIDRHEFMIYLKVLYQLQDAQ